MILVYEPQELLAKRLLASLKKARYDAVLCDVNSMPELRKNERPLILMDAQLQWNACRPLLERFFRHRCPILFITDERKMSTHLRALYSGCSDVLVVPFSDKSLLMKVYGLLIESKPSDTLKLDAGAYIAYMHGHRIDLTPQEYALLAVLIENRNMPVSREVLLHKAWGFEDSGKTRTVDVFIQRLRKKLGYEYIQTVYRYGYCLKEK